MTQRDGCDSGSNRPTNARAEESVSAAGMPVHTMYECESCGDLQRHSEQNDVYGCHCCGGTRVEVRYVLADDHRAAIVPVMQSLRQAADAERRRIATALEAEAAAADGAPDPPEKVPWPEAWRTITYRLRCNDFEASDGR